MIEIPEADVLARQLNQAVIGKTIAQAEAAHSPHKFAWYQGNPADYPVRLEGRTIQNARPQGGALELHAGEMIIALSEGIRFSFHPAGSDLPDRHQLLLRFSDGSALSAVVQMYGGLLCFRQGEADNPYYLVATQKPSPLTDDFDRVYFDVLIQLQDLQPLSVKALLATEQRIPGLGNGVLQDILYHAGLHPKRKLESVSGQEKDRLFESIKQTLRVMAEQGGRDTEKDLFGEPGGYATCCSKNTVGKPCEQCGSQIQKAAYMGGSIYFCPGCQTL